MAALFKTPVARRNAMIDNWAAHANSGFIDIYDGSRPATSDTAVGAQVKLARLTFNATAFAAASSGSATANAITQDSSADATGTATWFRLWKSDGTTALGDGTVGTSAENLNLNTVSIVSGAIVQISSFTVSQAEGA